jgi:hypothetical protein
LLKFHFVCFTYCNFALWPAQVSGEGPVQDVCDVALLSFFYNRIYVLLDFWEHCQVAFPNQNVVDMFDFIDFDIDYERSEFIRSLAHRGTWPPS